MKFPSILGLGDSIRFRSMQKLHFYPTIPKSVAWWIGLSYHGLKIKLLVARCESNVDNMAWWKIGIQLQMTFVEELKFPSQPCLSNRGHYTTICWVEAVISQCTPATAESLDKNRLRIFQPTLGFLSAIGGTYGNYERGYPQVLNGLVLKGFIWWGFCKFILAWY